MSTITLTGNYGSTPYRISGLASGTTVDAETASWIQANSGVGGAQYPFLVYDSPNVVIDGGTIVGNIDMTGEWRDVYDDGNSAAIRTEGTPNVVIRDWRITDTWDAIRVSWDSQNFLIEDIWVTNARDDVIENDKLNSGVIRDSLFDGVFAGLSIDPSSSSPVDGSNETVTFDGVLMRMQPYLYEGMWTHASPIKTDSATNGEITPNLRFTNNVFAIEDVNHRSYRSMEDAWANTVELSGNYFLNLSDTPLPAKYPMPPAGWTVLQGQEARDYWTKAKDEWIERREGGEIEPLPPPDDVLPDTPPPPVDEAPETVPPPVDLAPEPAPPSDVSETPTFDGVKFEGSNRDEIIIGNALDNFIDGNNGDDILKGGAGDDIIRGDDGVDTLWGGAGKDTFFFKRLGDSREKSGVDTIMDFVRGEDKIDLSNIDANAKMSGHQAFQLISGEPGKTPGQLSVNFDAASGHTIVAGNTDTDLTAEFMLRLYGNIPLTSSDFVLGGATETDPVEQKPDAAPPVDGPSETEPPPSDVSETPTFEGVKFEGDNGDEIIIGNALDNFIDGNNGDDILKGGAGDDIIRGDDGVDALWGGPGKDTFFFKRLGDSREKSGVDTIMDFVRGEDKIDLSAIDANAKVRGDQAFQLISGELGKTPGQLNVTFDAASGHTIVNGNTDTDLAPELTFRLYGNVALTSADFVL